MIMSIAQQVAAFLSYYTVFLEDNKEKDLLLNEYKKVTKIITITETLRYLFFSSHTFVFQFISSNKDSYLYFLYVTSLSVVIQASIEVVVGKSLPCINLILTSGDEKLVFEGFELGRALLVDETLTNS